jgi:hypothetical protein
MANASLRSLDRGLDPAGDGNVIALNMRTASSRPKRRLAQPPARTAYFSIVRKSGVIFRVQMMRASIPATAETIEPVADAIPLKRQRQFSAVRCALDAGTSIRRYRMSRVIVQKCHYALSLVFSVSRRSVSKSHRKEHPYSS